MSDVRPIDANALNVDDLPCYYGEKCRLDEVEGWIADAPTLDYEPVRHGQWRHYKLSVPKGRGQTYLVYGCSLCHKHEKKRSDFCPNCGAKMDGGRHD